MVQGRELCTRSLIPLLNVCYITIAANDEPETQCDRLKDTKNEKSDFFSLFWGGSVFRSSSLSSP